MNVLVAAGGTGGHVNPALAVAEVLDERGDSVVFLGGTRGMERDLVGRFGFDIELIDIEGLDRSRPTSLPRVAGKAAVAVSRARHIIRERAIDVVLGMGGYVSLPAALGAGSARIPLVIHEQNIVLGLANRLSRPIAASVAVSWERTLEAVGDKGVLTGDPVTASIARFDRDALRPRALKSLGLSARRKTVLFFGGSLGARTINEAAIGLRSLWAGRSDVQIVHIHGSGGAHGDTLGGRKLIYRPVEYLEGMADAYAVADIAVCRGGATTVAELTAVGLGSIIVPYPHHRDRQQELHASVLTDAGAARTIADRELTTERLETELDALMNKETLGALGAAARILARPDAAVMLADLVVRSAPLGDD
ncbi:MAG TPA: undecaprenyldiphospho-muramoylpentapeptide beta-N-acetylglucosaminyltransferase [Actinomycetota bacterium]|nr:undecaprenyldiphospho-muramoylpentapeptide beta-N-acetylglucosaminyltransferase [Actinomycetota bacterium]